jgi:purine-nucleoside phosphorylase
MDPQVKELVDRCAAQVAERNAGQPIDWYLVCGSGMGTGLVGDGADGLGLDVELSIPLAELGLPAPSVEGHGQSLVFGRLGDCRVCVQSGRIHPYEGHPIQVCTAALEAGLRAGAAGLVVTAAVGGVVPELNAGDLLNIRDQMNLFGPTPLVGPRFIDCSRLYAPELVERIRVLAEQQGKPIRAGVYAHARGPQYETPTEVSAMRSLGGDVVGMSTTYEVILAAAHGRPAAGVAVVTNVAGQEGLNHLEVQELADQARGRLSQLLAALMSKPVGL